jgi:hypothetical protein
MKISLAITVLGIAASTFAQDHEHDGFLFRTGLGIASTSATLEDNSGNSLSMDGMSFGLNILQLGYSITPEVAIALELSGTKTNDPDVSMGDNSGKLDGTVLGNGMFGPSLSYFIMPQNVYVSGALGFGVGVTVQIKVI